MLHVNFKLQNLKLPFCNSNSKEVGHFVKMKLKAEWEENTGKDLLVSGKLKLWNNFHHVSPCKMAKTWNIHPQHISKHSEDTEESLYAQGQGYIQHGFPVIFRLSGSAALKAGMIHGLRNTSRITDFRKQFAVTFISADQCSIRQRRSHMWTEITQKYHNLLWAKINVKWLRKMEKKT